MSKQTFNFADFAHSNTNAALSAFKTAESSQITADSLVIATMHVGLHRGNDKVKACVNKALTSEELTGDIILELLCNVFGMLAASGGDYVPTRRTGSINYSDDEVNTIKSAIRRNLVIVQYFAKHGESAYALMKDGKTWGALGSLCVAKGEAKTFDENLMKAYWKVARSSKGMLVVSIADLRKLANAAKEKKGDAKSKRAKKETDAPVSMVKGLTDASAALAKESDGAGEHFAKETRETMDATLFELGRVRGLWDAHGNFDAADITAFLAEVMEAANVAAQVKADEKKAA